MKKILSLTLTAVLLLGLIGCKVQSPPVDTRPLVTESTGATETTAPATDPTEAETTRPTDPSEVTAPTQSTEATEGTEPAQPEKPKEESGKQESGTEPTKPVETEPTQPATEPTDPPTTQPTETTPEETQQQETVPAETEPPSTEPPTEATEPETQPTEPAGCQHDWICVHHDEVGHWRAGIMCDCGWTVYGDPDGLVAQWNAHSASYPAAESLLEHGGFGSMDEWFVDTPAYDEWVCRHCAEKKP